jgi:hypothetical protein
MHFFVFILSNFFIFFHFKNIFLTLKARQGTVKCLMSIISPQLGTRTFFIYLFIFFFKKKKKKDLWYF